MQDKTKRIQFVRSFATIQTSFAGGKEYDVPAKRADEIVAEGHAVFVAPAKAIEPTPEKKLPDITDKGQPNDYAKVLTEEKAAKKSKGK
jgi:hypothetical protein